MNDRQFELHQASFLEVVHYLKAITEYLRTIDDKLLEITRLIEIAKEEGK